MNTAYDYATATPLAPEIAEHYRREIANTLWLSRRSRRRLPKKIREAITAIVATANGQRRSRLLTADEIADDIARVIEAPGHYVMEHTHGGHVANAYGYAAYATGSLVLRDGNVVRIAVTTVSASKGSTGFGRLDMYTRDSEAAENARASVSFGLTIRLY